MDFFFKGMNETSECPFNEQDIQRCPFLRNISKPTSFSFSCLNIPIPLSSSSRFFVCRKSLSFQHISSRICPFISGNTQGVRVYLQVRGANGPIFEDGPNFDTAFKLFHGKDGVVPLSERPFFHDKSLETKPAPQFNPLAAKAASISLSGFGSGGPFGFDFFSKNWNNQKKKSESSKKRKQSSQGGDSSKHEALGNEWLETGNCPIAKSYRAVSHVLPLVATALQPPPGMKIKCPPAVVAARAALARTALVKSLRPQPLPAKILVIGVLGMAANIPLGIWREHTQKFSLSWFTAVHASVPFIAMLRKSVLMPKNAMVLTIGASILGQVIGSRAERFRLKAVAEREKATNSGAITGFSSGSGDGITGATHCGTEGMMWDSLPVKASGPTSSSANVCF